MQTVDVDGQAVPLAALPLIFEQFRGAGKAPGAEVTQELLETVKIYNDVPAGTDDGARGRPGARVRRVLRPGASPAVSRTATYHTTVAWTGEHWGTITMGNGPEMDFSAPPDAQGHAGVLTPEDAFVAAANTCVMMMFIWATERFRLDLQSYDCRAEGTKLIELDRTETFTHLRLWPQIRIRAGAERAGRRRGPCAEGPASRPRSTAWWPTR